MLRIQSFRRGFAGLAVLLALAWPLQAEARPPAGGDERPYAVQPEDGRPRGGGHGSWLDVLVPVGIGVVVACALACKGKSAAPSAKALLEDGPAMPSGQPFGTFSIYGFVRDGWPIVVDYPPLPPGVEAALTVVVGKDRWRIPIPGGRDPLKVFYDGGGAPAPKPALFVVEAFSRNPDGSQTPQNVELAGIGCGPRAVGSITINSLTFRPSARVLGFDYARYAYVASAFFNQVEQEILLYGGTKDQKTGADVITVTPVAKFRTLSRPPGRYGPVLWDGLVQRTRKPAQGPHRVRVRAWETDNDASWVASISREVVWAP
jgi:hypothetical protein